MIGKNVQPLHLNAADFSRLLEQQGPSLGLWRATEVAALREQVYEQPILDLGCGDGLVTSMVLPRVDVGLDPDERAVQAASRLGIYSRFEVVPAETARLDDESMVTVVSNSVLEHLPNLDNVLGMVSRVLRPGGRLIFTAPTEAFSAWLALPVSGYTLWRNRQLRHLNLWPVEVWAWHLRLARLEVETVRCYLRPQWVRAWDVLELFQQVWIGQRRVAGLIWRRIPLKMMRRLGQWAAGLDLSAPEPGGGRLIVARKL